MVTIISKPSNGGGGTAATSKVKVSAVDTTEDYLSAKLVAGTDISLTASGAGNETLTIDYTGTGGGIASVVAGTGISVDNTDPANPIVTATYEGADKLSLDQTTPETVSNGTPRFNEGIFGGTTSNKTDFPLANTVVSTADTGHTYPHPIGVVGEAVSGSDAGNTATGIGGVASTNGPGTARGVVGVGKVTASADTGASVGVRGRATDTHAGDSNIGVYSTAQNGATNYSFYGAAGNIHNEDFTASRVAGINATKEIVGLDTATYPSLTELAYVKGLTSSAQSQLNGKKYYHGVYARATISPLPTNLTTTTFTLAANTTNIIYYYLGTPITVSTAKTATLDDGLGGSTAGIYYVYFNGATGNILATKAFPGISNTSNVLIADVFWNGTDYGVVTDNRHGYDRDHAWHERAHDTIGPRYQSGLAFSWTGNVVANTTFAIGTGAIHDEDIDFTVAATQCRLWYQTSATTYGFTTTLSTVPYLNNGTNIQSVNPTGYGLSTITSSNRYFNYFIYATTDVSGVVQVVAETTATVGGYTSVGAARAVTPPNISGIMGAERKLIYRLVVNGPGNIQTPVAADDYRTTSTISGGASATVNAAGVTENNFGNVQTAINTILAQTAGYSTTATAAGTTTLDSSSTHQQFFTGTTTETVVLPVVNTLTIGTTYTIINKSTGAVTVQSSGANEILVLAAGTQADFTSTAITGTDATVWHYLYEGEIVSSGKKLTVTDNASITGTNTGDQTLANTSDGTSHTVTLSASGGSIKLIEGTGITLTTGGSSSAGEVTIASTATGGYNPVLAQIFF